MTEPVVTDRLGSVRRRMDLYGTWGPLMNYFPYGEEQVVTASDKEKFGTYLRDQKTNLDYADQRYFASGFGRFVMADPYEASGGASDPASWNRYVYVHGDPINFTDRPGLQREVPGFCDWYPWAPTCNNLPDNSSPSLIQPETGVPNRTIG